ncbi:MAG: (2Fe-2S)-binding protein, partial [Planctomycetota bacterium]
NRGRIVGAVSVGEWDELAQVRTAVTKTRKIRSWQVERFRTEGRIWDEDAVERVADWADGAIVCSCIGVTKGTLCEAMAAKECGTVEALSACTKAGTVCGSCRPLLADLVGAPVGKVKVRGAVPLIAASLLAVPMVGAVAAYELPLPDSYMGTLAEWDRALTDSGWKQATGWTVAGVTAVSLLLSLRKRVSWVSWGDYGFWRAAHSLLGVLTLVGLFAHTGWRMGENLNFWLMATFLTTNFVGGFTGILSGMEGKLSGESARLARTWRPRLTWLHVLTFWPVPVLLVFHVIGAYWHIN